MLSETDSLRSREDGKETGDLWADITNSLFPLKMLSSAPWEAPGAAMLIHSSMWLRSVARVSRSSVPHHAPSRSWREEGKNEASMGLCKLHESIWHLADQACTWMQNCWCLLLLWRGHGKILFLSGTELCLHVALVITCTARDAEHLPAFSSAQLISLPCGVGQGFVLFY